VAGHNWSPFLRGAGGRGVAPALGALLVVAWPGAVLLMVGLLAGKLFGEKGIGALVAELALTPVLAVWGGRVAALAGAAIAVPMLVKRVLGNGPPAGDRRRAYVHRLIYDNDQATDSP
jgi:acyl phosphate:glycerol-3-phosphate acyltransferase